MRRWIGFLLCLFVGIPLAGAGGLAAWVAGKSLWDAHRAGDWVRVRVDVVPGQFDAKPRGPGSGHFAYAFDGHRHEGRRLALGGLGGNDDIDAWRTERTEDLQAAKSAGQSVSVWVNPDDPAESVLDRGIRWHEPILLGLLVLGFGPAGIGALVSAAKMAMGTASSGAASNAGAGAVFLWIFAVIWNTMAFGAGWLVLSDILESREWAGLFVLLFPFVGIFLIWGAAGATVNLIKVRFAGAPGGTPRGSSPAPSVPTRNPAGPAGAFAAQAARAMFDPPRSHTGAAAPLSIDLPASVAQVAVLGGVLTVRFSRRRWLSTAILVFAIGAVLTLVGAFMMIDEDIGVGAMIVFALRRPRPFVPLRSWSARSWSAPGPARSRWRRAASSAASRGSCSASRSRPSAPCSPTR